ncbi:MAG: nitroreductase/quinone reductase family protein [Mycobacterium sp.]
MNSGSFPAVRSGPSRDNPLFRPLDAFTASKYGSRVVRMLIPIDHWLMRRTKGRFTFLGPLRVPTLVLTTTGRKSGERREIVLTYMRDGDRLYVVASNSGGPKHPAWSLNLLADPSAWVTIKGRQIPVTAAQVTGEEYDRMWKVFTSYSRVFPAYRGRMVRELRMFALSKR